MFTMPDERFAACAGFDALAYCRALKLMLLMSLYITVTTMVVVLPVNLTGHYVDRQPKPDSEACVSTQADPTNVRCLSCTWLLSSAFDGQWMHALAASPHPSLQSRQAPTLQLLHTLVMISAFRCIPRVVSPVNIKICKSRAFVHVQQVASATSPPPPSASACASAVTSFDKTSMTNIDERTESNRLWAHCVALWIITLFVMKVRGAIA